MLRIYFGENQGEKLGIFAREIKDILKNGGRAVAVVPDQFSFGYDRALYSELGPEDFNKVEVTSFEKLAESLIGRFGTLSGTLMTQSERDVIIFLALKKTSPKQLKLLSRSLEKPAFAAEISGVIDRLVRSGIRPEDLKTASERLGGTLGDKLSDVCEIYTSYLSLLSERSLRDESSLISEGAAIAAKNAAFKGAYVYIDRFDSFSPDELMLARVILRDSAALTVSLSMPEKIRRSAVSPFSRLLATQNELVKIAAELNSQLKFSSCNVPATSDPVLSGVGACLYEPIKEKVPAGGSVELVRADNMYEEADFVAAKIRKLVTREGYNFNDIAVITHDLDSYSGIFEASFSRYGVEAFIDRPQPAAGMSLVLFALDAIDAAASRTPDTDKILKYIRSPFSPLDYESVSLLWDYCVRWNIDGDLWLSDFLEPDQKLSEKLNLARKTAIEPLIKLRDSSRRATAKEISAAFCEFLKDIDAARRAYKVIEDCADEDIKLETARLFKQLWNAVMSSVTTVYLTAGEEKMTLRAFGDLLRLMLSRTSVSNPPQKLESVTVADVRRSVITRPKIAFVVGLADGLFPADVKKSGLFSGRDLKALESVGVSFDLSPEVMLSSERLDCYKALSSPTERLILSYSGSDLRSRELRPSRFIRRITDYCGVNCVYARTLGAEFYCSTPAAAYYSSSVSKSISPEEKAGVKAALSTVPEYAEKLMRLNNSGSNAHRLSPSVSRKLFASKDVNVTASRIDVYNRCAFEYFCKFGLKLEPVRPIAVDPASRGTVMHYIFENVLENFKGDFSEASDEEIKELVKKYLDKFSEENLGGDFAKSAKFRADYARLGGAAEEILLNMREEFKVSKFRPERFEYDLSKQDGQSVLSIPLSGGVKLNIRGIVDRVDTYIAPDGRRFIRVIDYKTGEKKFCLEDIYNGINLQLLLYMLALTEGRDADFKDCIPSGILYMRAGFLECKDSFDPLSKEQKTRLERSCDQLKRNGLIVTYPEAMEAMDEGYSGKFVPLAKKSVGGLSSRSEVISPKSFERLEAFAKEKTVRFGNDLLSGKIDAIPLGDDPEHLRCRFCDYSSVCDRRKYMMKLISPDDSEKLKAIINPEGESGDV